MRWTEDKLDVLAGCICLCSLSDKRDAFKMTSRMLGVTVKAAESAYYRHSSYIRNRLKYLEEKNVRKSTTLFSRISVFFRLIIHKVKSWFTYY